MFDQDEWRARIADRLSGFTRNPRQDIQLAGTTTVTGYLAVRALEPFLAAFQQEPVAAVLTLADITRGPGADLIVRRASQMRYQASALIEREMRTRAELRSSLEQIFVTLNVIHLARQRLNSSRDEWLRLTLLSELDNYHPSEFAQLRRVLHDPGWQSRYETIRSLRIRNGSYSAGDLVLLHDGLSDSASHVRAASARMLGQFAGTPPPPLVKALTRVALYDCDLETRFAAARTLGALRDRIASPQLLDHLGLCLSDEDSFVRSAAALALGQLGELAGAPNIINRLTALVGDHDPYAREAGARALGRIGGAAATAPVIEALTKAMEDADANVHEAAIDAITRLRKSRMTTPLPHPPTPSEPLSV
ncbi:MAG: HEAT repeat domain-containing protein [Candidatus Viridilinea halotolerans]|uniref:HEAT repeat domain-containing protein n=1 Tax=Candidatus Viridilinea halotolerans TaxID=2491704 RepID=A0A426U008_9CHLR|nr:MAG: HEAT repeat domain-containing protein [Candidatus Viridilinea halotolerans]